MRSGEYLLDECAGPGIEEYGPQGELELMRGIRVIHQLELGLFVQGRRQVRAWKHGRDVTVSDATVTVEHLSGDRRACRTELSTELCFHVDSAADLHEYSGTFSHAGGFVTGVDEPVLSGVVLQDWHGL